MKRPLLPLLALLLNVPPALAIESLPAPSTAQHSEGACSPNVADVKGNVTITCQGVDPKTVAHLNELLEHKNLQLQEKIKEAEKWINRYKELETSLANQKGKLAEEAQAALRANDFEKVGKLLNENVEQNESDMEKTRLAETHANLALISQLMFRPKDALQHWEKAYRNNPDNTNYTHAYAFLLQQQNQFNDAIKIYEENLLQLRGKAQNVSRLFQKDVAVTLNNLGLLYSHTQQAIKAESAFGEAMEIFRTISNEDPVFAYSNMAMIFNNLGILYFNSKRPLEAEKSFGEALSIFHLLATSNPLVFLPYKAMNINNLGDLYLNSQRFQEAEIAFTEAQGIFIYLANTNPALYIPYLAKTINNMGQVYANTNRLQEADVAYQQAMQTFRALAKENPATFNVELAQILHNFAQLHIQTSNPTKAHQEAMEAMEIFLKMARDYPQIYGNHFAKSLNITLAAVAAAPKLAPPPCPTIKEARNLVQDQEIRTELDKHMAKHCPHR